MPKSKKNPTEEVKKSSIKREVKKITITKKTKKTSANEKITKVDETEKNSSLVGFAKYLSGEMTLVEEKERLDTLKKKAKERQREEAREGIRSVIKSGEAVLDAEGLEKKVVQNIQLFKWTAPVRIKFLFEFKSFLAIVSLILLFILYLAILGHYTLMVVMIALVFFLYVGGAIEPLETTHRITARGIETFDKLFEWFLLENFWFAVKNSQQMLIIETKLRYPTKLIMLLDEKEREVIFTLLQDKVLYKDVRKQGMFDKATYGEYMPLDSI